MFHRSRFCGLRLDWETTTFGLKEDIEENQIGEEDESVRTKMINK